MVTDLRFLLFQNSYKEDLERRRKENLKLNAEFFAKLGINEVRSENLHLSRRMTKPTK